jgi:hypothetical protein
MLLMNFSAGEFSSNLARQRVFPAWIQSLVKAISTHEPPPSSHTVGEPVQTEIWRNEMHDEVIGPGGAPIVTRRELTGQRCDVRFTPDQLGFYTLGAPRTLYAFGVNPPTEESDLRPIDKSVLPTEFSDNHEAHVVAGSEDYDELARGRPIFHWFVLSALLFLVMESGFQLLIGRRAA